MTLTEEILTVLTGYEKGYRLMRSRMHGYTPKPSTSDPVPHFRSASTNTLRVTLSRLKKKGFVQNKGGFWKITAKGRGRLTAIRHTLFPKHSPVISKTRKSKKMIIAFDIPEANKYKRNWLRVELANLGFEMLQQSMWLGPTPLPAQFISSLQELKILSYLKFFEAKETDII